MLTKIFAVKMTRATPNHTELHWGNPFLYVKRSIDRRKKKKFRGLCWISTGTFFKQLALISNPSISVPASPIPSAPAPPTPAS
jgi:hypothetical protein